MRTLNRAEVERLRRLYGPDRIARNERIRAEEDRRRRQALREAELDALRKQEQKVKRDLEAAKALGRAGLPARTPQRQGSTDRLSSIGILRGTPIRYATEVTIAGLFREQIAPGAAAKAVKRDDVRLLRDHDSSRLLARTASGTLELVDGREAVHMRASVPDTELGRETLALVERGDLTQMSFAFIPKVVRWFPPPNRGELPLAVVEDVGTLLDVSGVTFPAYKTTTLGAEAAGDGRTALDAVEARLNLRALLMSGRGSLVPPARLRDRLKSSAMWTRTFAVAVDAP